MGTQLDITPELAVGRTPSWRDDLAARYESVRVRLCDDVEDAPESEEHL